MFQIRGSILRRKQTSKATPSKSANVEPSVVKWDILAYKGLFSVRFVQLGPCNIIKSSSLSLKYLYLKVYSGIFQQLGKALSSHVRFSKVQPLNWDPAILINMLNHIVSMLCTYTSTHAQISNIVRSTNVNKFEI